MSGLRIAGAITNNIAEVNSANELKVSLSQSESTAGYAALTCETDSGSITGNRLMIDLEGTLDYRLRVGIDTLFFSEFFMGTTLNTSIWKYGNLTMTSAVSGGFLTLNSGSITTLNTGTRVSSARAFPLFGTATTYFESVIQFTQAPVAHNICEWGAAVVNDAFAPAGAPFDGAFFRFNAAGEFRCVVSNNGIELQSGTLSFATLIGQNTSVHCIVGITDDQVTFWINDVMVATISRSAAQPTPTASNNLQICFRNYNDATGPSLAQVMKVSMVNVTVSDVQMAKNWKDVRAGAGDLGYQGPTGSATLTTAQYSNSLGVGSGATLLNTTGNAGYGLGGQFTVIPFLTAGTDGIVSNFQVPTGSATAPAKSLYVTSVNIGGAITNSISTGPVIGTWSLAYGHTNASLATTETGTIKAPRRIPLGMQTFVPTAGNIMGTPNTVSAVFDVPVLVQPGEFVQTVMKNIGSPVPVGGTITYLITFTSYWE